MAKMQLIMKNSLRDQTMDLVYSTSNIRYITVFCEPQPFGTICAISKTLDINYRIQFFHANFYKKKRKRKKGKNPTGLYKNGHNWLMHILHDLGIAPSTLRCNVCVIWHQRVKQISPHEGNLVIFSFLIHSRSTVPAKLANFPSVPGHVPQASNFQL
jgi:hypothetical protein